MHGLRLITRVHVRIFWCDGRRQTSLAAFWLCFKFLALWVPMVLLNFQVDSSTLGGVQKSANYCRKFCLGLSITTTLGRRFGASLPPSKETADLKLSNLWRLAFRASQAAGIKPVSDGKDDEEASKGNGTRDLAGILDGRVLPGSGRCQSIPGIWHSIFNKLLEKKSSGASGMCSSRWARVLATVWIPRSSPPEGFLRIRRTLQGRCLCPFPNAVCSKGVYNLGLDIRSADVLHFCCFAFSRARERNLGLVSHRLPQTTVVVTHFFNNRR